MMESLICPQRAILDEPIYIAGPMTGYVAWNYPEFRRWERLFWNAGIEYKSPCVDEPDDTPYTECLKQALLKCLECRSILLLPSWEKSKGAALEHDISRALGRQIWLPVYQKQESSPITEIFLLP